MLMALSNLCFKAVLASNGVLNVEVFLNPCILFSVDSFIASSIWKKSSFVDMIVVWRRAALVTRCPFFYYELKFDPVTSGNLIRWLS